MSKSLYNYVRDQWKSPSGDVKNLHKTRLVQYRKEDATTKIERPTRIDRARALGYRACLLYTSPSPRDGLLSRMPSSA